MLNSVLTTTAQPLHFQETARRLKAIAHPMRIAIIRLLSRERALNVTQIYTQLGLEQAVASQHLKILKKQGIIDSERKGKHSYYFLKHEDVVKVVDLMKIQS